MSLVETIAEGVTLILGDAREIVPSLTPRCAGVITSPPYAQQRDYGSRINDWRGLVSGSLTKIRGTPCAQVFVNLGLVHKDGELIEYWRPFIDDMRDEGWRLFSWYVWDQGPGLAGDWAGRLAPAHEWIFHFNKKERAPHKTIACLHAGKTKRRGQQSGLRKTNGSASGWSTNASVTQERKIRDSVIRVMRQRYSAGAPEAAHPAVFPVALPASLIESYSDPDETILDPFMGSGTTGVAAVKLGRKFIGIEIEPKYFDIACRRISEALKQPDLFIDKPKPAVQEALL